VLCHQKPTQFETVLSKCDALLEVVSGLSVRCYGC